ncbi:hypothetical protein [Henriciella marina]|uniref:hypothetical protein n=1 Tax=Henriciella marina TaxID=453851 RepID=UPI00036E5FF9|nr:hypothetical protein [Henriciella marina]
MRNLIISLAGLGLIGACTSTGGSGTSASRATAEQNNYELAMGTVSALERAGNEQTAIDRLTQLLGDPALTDAQKAEILYSRAMLRYGVGNDLEGAIDDAEEIAASHPGSEVAADAAALLANAETERNAMVVRLEESGLSPMERFEILFELGRHEEAGDIMMASALQPGNEYVLDMFQIGYLCSAEDLSGPTYSLVEPDGTQRQVRFCNVAG